MPKYMVTAVIEGYEVYLVEADSEEEAAQIWEDEEGELIQTQTFPTGKISSVEELDGGW